MAPRLSDSEMLKLAQIYKSYDNLWNIAHSLYKNKHSRSDSYTEICEKLNIPGVSINDIPMKIKNLRSSYYQELKKINRSIQSGAGLYVPKVAWFSTVDGFLKPYIDSEHNFLVQDDHSNPSAYDNEAERNLESIQTNDACEHSDDTNTGAHVKMELEQEPFANCDPLENFESHRSIADISIPPVQPITQKPRPEIKKVGIAAAISRINEVASCLSRTTDSLQNADEFDKFGAYVAVTLRSLPQETSIVAKTEIQMTLQEIQLRVLRQAQALNSEK